MLFVDIRKYVTRGSASDRDQDIGHVHCPRGATLTLFRYSTVQSGAATCWKGFVICFLKVSPCLLWQHGSCSTAQQPGELSENVLQNLSNKLLPQSEYSVNGRVTIHVTCDVSYLALDTIIMSRPTTNYSKRDPEEGYVPY